MRPDSIVKHDIEQELHADPALDAADIAVAVQDGVVSPTGFVRFYHQKAHAEMAAKRVAGVSAVVDDIDVRLPVLHQRPDPMIARDAVEALERVLPDAAPHIQVTVRDGLVTLEGEVEWNSEREEAKWQVAPVRGVVGVRNNIRLTPKVVPEEVEAAVAAAIRRSAQLDAERIAVQVDGRGPAARDGPVLGRNGGGGTGGVESARDCLGVQPACSEPVAEQVGGHRSETELPCLMQTTPNTTTRKSGG